MKIKRPIFLLVSILGFYQISYSQESEIEHIETDHSIPWFSTNTNYIGQNHLQVDGCMRRVSFESYHPWNYNPNPPTVFLRNYFGSLRYGLPKKIELKYTIEYYYERQENDTITYFGPIGIADHQFTLKKGFDLNLNGLGKTRLMLSTGFSPRMSSIYKYEFERIRFQYGVLASKSFSKNFKVKTGFSLLHTIGYFDSQWSDIYNNKEYLLNGVLGLEKLFFERLQLEMSFVFGYEFGKEVYNYFEPYGQIRIGYILSKNTRIDAGIWRYIGLSKRFKLSNKQ